MTNTTIIYFNSDDSKVQVRVTVQTEQAVSKKEIETIRPHLINVIKSKPLEKLDRKIQNVIYHIKFEQIDLSDSEVASALETLLSQTASIGGHPNPELELAFAMHHFRHGDRE